jgi:hypothetical protein
VTGIPNGGGAPAASGDSGVHLKQGEVKGVGVGTLGRRKEARGVSSLVRWWRSSKSGVTARSGSVTQTGGKEGRRGTRFMQGRGEGKREWR